MKIAELKDGHKYIGTATDGKQYEFTFVDKYLPGGVCFGTYPAYTADGRKNEIIDYKEVSNE